VACPQMKGKHSCSLPLAVQLCPQVDWLTCIRGSQLYERYKLASGESNGNLITLGLRGNKNDKLMLLYFPFLTVG
jgi:patatin-like phospholipase/acyl hydrolase